MKKIVKSIFTLLTVALAMVACKDAQPEVNTDLMNSEVAARETLAISDGYYHGDVYETGGGSYKITLTLLSENMTIDHKFSADAHSELFTGFGGTGYAFELEFNSEFEDSIAPGIYSADTMDYNGEYYMNDILTYHPENSYLTVVHNGNNVKQVLSTDTKVNVKVSNAGIYTITIEGENAVGIPVKGTYVGAIDLNDIYYYREPATAETINIVADAVTYAPDSYNDSYALNYGYTLHWLTIEGTNGELAELQIVSAPTDISSLPSSVYGFVEGFYNMLTSNNTYDTEMAYREDGTQYGSFLSMNGDIYYLSGDVEVEMNATGTTVESLKLVAVSAYGGSDITIEYTKPTAEEPVVPVEPAVTTAKVWGVITAGDPLAGATVTVTSTDGSTTYSATSAADGKYSVIVEDLTKTYKLVVSADGYESWTYADPANGFNEEFTLLAGQELAISANLNAVSTTVLIMGEVVDSETKEAIEAELTVSIADAGMPDDTIDELPTDAGMFEFEVETEMVYVITISDSAGVYETHSFEVEVGDADVELDPVELTKKATE